MPVNRSTKALAARYEQTAGSLCGKRITHIAYHPLLEGDDARGIVEDWDFGAWHAPTMGVVFGFDDGSAAVATWDSTFTEYGLEVTVSPKRAGLRHVGPPGAPNEVVVTGHERWAKLVDRRLSAVEICWEDVPLSDLRLPLAVRLEAGGRRGTSVWLAAGVPAAWPFDGGFRLGTDDVLVIFERALAVRAGIPGRAAARARAAAAAKAQAASKPAAAPTSEPDAQAAARRATAAVI